MSLDNHKDAAKGSLDAMKLRLKRQTELMQYLDEAKWYKSLAENFSDVLWTTDLEFNTVYISPSIFTLTGDTPENHIKKSLSERYPPTSAEMLIQLFTEEMLEEENPNNDPSRSRIIEAEFYKTDGSTVWVSINVSFIRDKAGRAIGIKGLTRDISQRKHVEDILNHTRQSYLDILNSLSEAIYVQSLDGTFIDVNEGAARMYKCSREDLIGKTPNDLAAPGMNDLEMIAGKIKQVHETGIPSTFEFWAVRANGEHFPKEIILNRGVYFSQPVIIATARDITNTKKIQQSLIDSEQLHRKILMTVPDLVVRADLEGTIVYVNEEALASFSISSPDHVIGHNVFSFITDDDLPRAMENYQIMLQNKVGLQEYKINNPDGLVFDCEVNADVILDSQNQIAGMVYVLRDVSERKRAEKQLSLQTHLRQLLVEISSEYINLPIDKVETEIAASMNKLSDFVHADRCYICDFDDTTDMFSITYEWCGENIEKLINTLQNVPLHPDWVDAFKLGKPLYIPDVSKLPDGLAKQTLMPRKVITLIALPMIHNGRCIGFVGFDSLNSRHYYSKIEQQLLQVFTQMLVNIRLRQKNEKELIEAKEKAEDSDRLKLAFLANMSHEIRTPMNGILGFASLLKEANLTGDQRREFIELIEKSGIRMLNVLNDIISISKIEAGLMTLNKKEINVNDQVEYIHAFFKHEVTAKGMKLFSHSPLPLHQSQIYTDPEKLYAILSNLVKNSIKYSDGGTIQIGYDKQGDRLIFYVRDTGIGIPKSKQESIFERFVQVDNSTSRAYEGAGLGLSIAKAYVQMLGGSIWVESEVGKGSCFYFDVPYETSFKTGNQLFSDAETLTDEQSLSRLNVLIAEDEDISFQLIYNYISGFCSNVLRAKTGIEAVEIYSDNPELDLILMDVKMPEMDGYEATRQIRKTGSEIVIIAQTAYGLTSDVNTALLAGCNDYIAKPINKLELTAMIQKHLKKDKSL